MSLLILGLLLFLGAHSVRMLAPAWREAQIAQRGEGPWKGAYSLLSALGLVLIVYGYGQARLEPVVLWPSPVWTRHLAALLTLPAFVLLALSQVPGHSLKARIRHPMVLAVKFWATAHLLANNTAADVLLFGAFLAWAVLDFRSARRRPDAAPAIAAQGAAGRTVLAVVIGLVAWVAFAFWGHAWLIGVRPFG